MLAFTPYDGELLEQVVFSGLTQPVAIEFAANGRIFVAEKAGIIKTYDSLTDTTASIALDYRAVINSAVDRGLLGMALDPNFTSNGHVYLLYTWEGDIGQPARTSNLDLSTSTVSGKLSRFTFSNGQLTNEQLLIHDWPAQYPSHTIGHLMFGPDGYLYASGGDGASYNNVDYGQFGNPFNDPVNEGGALRSQDILSDGDPLGLDGTIIRINPSTGAGAPGNPFAGSADANKARIIAAGLRNPYRFNFRPGTSEIWLGDVGWNGYEEINRFDVSANATPNFGWPAFEGPGWQSGYHAANLPLLQGLYNGSVAHAMPYYAYHHSDRIDTSATNEPTGGSAITGVAFYTADRYPYAFEDALFFADYARKTIYTMRRGSNGLPDVSTRKLMQVNAAAVELEIGPQGDIFYVDIVAGRVVRLTHSGPSAMISADKTSGSSPLTVNFSAAGSTDPDEYDVLSFAWDLDGDGAFDDATGITASYTYITRGTHQVSVRATDLGGNADVATIAIHVGGGAPTPTILSPTNSLKWSVGQKITFQGSATDLDDGNLPASALSWRLVLMHANADNLTAHEHLVASLNGVAGGSFDAPDHDYPSWIELRLTAIDSDNNATTITRRLDPQTANIHVGSSTAGVAVAFNGSISPTPFVRTAIVGSTVTIGMQRRQVVAGDEWRFDSWQDGAPFARTLIASTAGANLHINGYTMGWRALDGAPLAGNGWTGVALGASVEVARIGIRPQSGTLLNGGRIQGSNDPNFANAFRLYTFTSSPGSGTTTTLTLADGLSVGTAYRYFRYLAPNGGSAAIAEFHLASAQPLNAERGNIYGSAPLKGTYSFSRAADYKLTTSYEANKAKGSWIAVDLGSPKPIDILRFAPRLDAARWMRGGKFQVATRADFGDAITIFSLVNSAHTGWNEYRVDAGSYRYVRYMGPSGSYSKIAEFNIYSDPPLDTPRKSGAVSVVASDTAQGVRLSWSDESLLETGYRVRRQTGNGNWVTVANLNANTTSYTDGNVVAGATYQYRIIPMNDAGYGAWQSASATVTVVAQPPAKPTNLQLIRNSDGSIGLTWSDVATNETSYRIERRYTNHIWETIATLDAGSTSYRDAAVFGGAAYEYRVIAVNAVGESIGDGKIITA